MVHQADHAHPAVGRRDKLVAPDERPAPQSLNSQNGRLPSPDHGVLGRGAAV